MVSETKKTFVQQMVEKIKEYPVVAIVNFQNLPAPQLQKMRALLLKSGVEIVMARKKLLQLALNESGKEKIEQLNDKVKGMPALLFSKSNPFTLYKNIQKNKSEAPAKAGQIAPKDVRVKAGATNFAPGPIISELASVGIKTKVENGKLAIINDVVVVKEGDEISQKVAETLKRLDIKPMEIGLDLVAVWENGLVFDAKQLHIDEAEYLQKITDAATWAMNLAVEAAIVGPETTELLLQKAFRDAKALAIEQHILNDETKEDILGKVENQAKALKDAANVEVSQKPVKETVEEPAKEETKVEETKAEEPAKEEAKVEEPAKEEAKVEEPAKEEAKVEEDPQPIPNPQPDPEPTPEPVPEPKTNKESHIPTAQDLIKETIDKFEKTNFPVEEKVKKVQRQEEKVTAESLVAEEKAIAQIEKKRKEANEEKKDSSVEQAENLFEKLKKQGTLRNE